MGEEHSTFAVLGRASERKLFHAQNGLDISSIRELAVQLSRMDLHTFEHHVNENGNDFATWIRDVFGDNDLAEDIEASLSPKEMADLLSARIVELEDKELIRFGIDIPSEELNLLEKYIEQKRAKNISYDRIKENLTKKGWKKQILELIIEAKDNPYKQYSSLESIEDMEQFHQLLEQLKRHILNAIAAEVSVNTIKKALEEIGWKEEVIDFIFFDIFKPHPNIKKLSTYIEHQIKEKGASVDKVKKDLQKLGWKAYLIDSVIYGLKEPENSLTKILEYLEEFSPNNHDQIKKFLLQMGWNESAVSNALEKKQIIEVEKKLRERFNMEQGEVFKQYAKSISTTVIRIAKRKEINDAWKDVITKHMKKIRLEEFAKSGNELHLEEEYTYYYSAADIESIRKLDNRNFEEVYYSSAQEPLVIDSKNRYFVLPLIISRACVVCGKKFRANKLKRFEMWDGERTHKVERFVCEEHADQMELLLDSTKIVQGS